jgi:hypothetical protein
LIHWWAEALLPPRPAAVYAGVIEEGASKRFGWDNLRHLLAEFLASEVNPAVTMKTLCH